MPHLVRAFAEEFAARDNRPAPMISPATLRASNAHRWPGNIRELRNVIERAGVHCGRTIEPEDLPDSLHGTVPATPLAFVEPVPEPMSTGPVPTTLSESRESAELSRIREGLRLHKNNRLRAAAELGISRMTLSKAAQGWPVRCLRRTGLGLVPGSGSIAGHSGVDPTAGRWQNGNSSCG